jgi:hypothetical protein
VGVVKKGKECEVRLIGFSASATHETHFASIFHPSAFPASNGRNRLSPVVLSEDATGNSFPLKVKFFIRIILLEFSAVVGLATDYRFQRNDAD